MIKKYEKIFKEESDEWFKEHVDEMNEISKDTYRLQFHLMPDIGWLNDPNGLFEKDGITHIYYQYCPYDMIGSLKTWGHFTTKDFIHYEKHDIFLYPDSEYDKHGAYSGSAFVENDNIHYFYTGNIKYFDKDNYDYIHSGRGSNTIHLLSKDGFTFDKKTCLLSIEDYHGNLSNHVRDPKVFKLTDTYYMVLGARDKNSKGCILMYNSMDLENWNYVTLFSTDETFGYMWECPDMFQLNNQWILLCCPQGVETQGINYENVHQSVYMTLDVDFDNKQFKITSIHQLDRGFDFYAQQTYEDEKGRRICIGWMGLPDIDYTNPTVEKGWQHALTLPRELVFENHVLKQKPLEEMKKLRKKAYILNDVSLNTLKFDNDVYEMKVTFSEAENVLIRLRDNVTISYENDILTLDTGKSGYGRGKRSVKLNYLENLHIFSDTSSVEIFVNDGEEVFTSRIYCEKKCECQIHGTYKECKIDLYELDGFNYEVKV